MVSPVHLKHRDVAPSVDLFSLRLLPLTVGLEGSEAEGEDKDGFRSVSTILEQLGDTRSNVFLTYTLRLEDNTIDKDQGDETIVTIPPLNPIG